MPKRNKNRIESSSDSEDDDVRVETLTPNSPHSSKRSHTITTPFYSPMSATESASTTSAATDSTISIAATSGRKRICMPMISLYFSALP